MRIFDPRFDYYDSIQKHGQDQSLIYFRKSMDIDIKPDNMFEAIHLPESKFTNAGIYNFSFEAIPIVLGFCGEIYPCINLSFSQIGRQSKSITAYNSEAIGSFIDSIPELDIIRDEFGGSKVWGRWYYGNRLSKKNCDMFFRSDGTLTNRTEKYFSQFKCPIFCIKKNVLTTNPILKDFNFAQMVDPFTAYQEISMYLSGVIGIGEPEMVNISDKEMLTKRGFDKFSFRKQK